MSENSNDDNLTADKKNEHKLLISRIRSGISRRRNRIRSLNDMANINIDSIPEDITLSEMELLQSGKTIDWQLDLDSKISEIRSRIRRRTSNLSDALNTRKEISQLKDDLKELQTKERLRHVITRVNEEARQKLFNSDKFAALFAESNECDAVILAIDIRRSTELMLRALSPELYAEFITALTEKISDCITGNFGIFEKFTGDGALAFFPDFYSGADSLLWSLNTAEECHKIFREHFDEYREYFHDDMVETGFGIGIDCGRIFITSINGDLSIVGEPVVYACRYSAAPAGKTWLTGRAYIDARKLYGEKLCLSDVNVDIKHEGNATGYEIAGLFGLGKGKKPDWDYLIRLYSETERVF